MLLFATSKEQIQKMLYEFKESTEKVGLKIHRGKTKVLSNQSSLCSVDDIKIEIMTRSESVRYPGQLITFQQQETTEIKNRIRAVWVGDVPQVQAGTDIEKLHAQTSSPTVRRSSNSDDMLRIWNVGTHQRARKNDTIGATQNAPTHHTNKKEDTKRS